MDINQTYCGDHFAIYTNIKSCYTPETRIMLNVNYTSIYKMNLKSNLKKEILKCNSPQKRSRKSNFLSSLNNQQNRENENKNPEQ